MLCERVCISAVGFLTLNAIQSTALQLPKLGSIFKPTTRANASLLETRKKELLEAVSYTANGKTASPEKQAQVLSIVGEIEQLGTPSETLLSDPDLAQGLDGVWYLQYTSPSKVGDEDQFPTEWKPAFASEGEANIETKPFTAQGSVVAQGITVDTSNRLVRQSFDIPNTRVTNDVTFDFGVLSVGGSFRPSNNVPRRAVVSFEELKVKLNNGLQLQFDFLFAIASALRGTKESGWLETTYLGEDMRIGRGNKGTMFVLTRDVNAVKP